MNLNKMKINKKLQKTKKLGDHHCGKYFAQANVVP